MKRDLYSDVTARILQSMEAGVMPWEKAWKAGGTAMPMNAVTNRPYSGINVLLFWLSADCGYAKPRYLTFKQAKEAGGNVRKGEQGRGIPARTCDRRTPPTRSMRGRQWRSIQTT